MWNSSRLSFLECYRVWVWCVWSFSSVIFGREVIYPLLSQKANSCRDSLERPGSHSKRRAGCFPHLGSEALSLSGKSCVCFQAACLLPLVTSFAAAALLPRVLSASVHPGWDTPGGSRRAGVRHRLAARPCVWRGRLFPCTAGQLLLTVGSSCCLGCRAAAHWFSPWAWSGHKVEKTLLLVLAFLSETRSLLESFYGGGEL